MSAKRPDRRPDFASVIHAEYERAYRFAWRLTGNEHDAVDLTQETFRIAWEKWATFKSDSSAATWLHRILYRRFIDQRRGSNSRDRVRDCIGRTAHFTNVNVRDHVATVETKYDVESALNLLGEQEKLVVVLRYFQDLSVAEVAMVTGDPEGTVKWRTKKALKLLRKVLE